MTPSWSAERVVSPAVARSLIEMQFADLAPATVEPLGAGMDNTAFCVNGAYVFRFPRRQFAVQFLEAETRLLPVLAPRLPLPVPVPTCIGQSTNTYPWPFAGYRMLPGHTACVAGLDEHERANIAGPLGRFLAVLHSIPTVELARLGGGPDTIGRLDLGRHLPRGRALLDQIGHLGLVDDIRPFTAVFDTAPATYGARSDIPMHGDLYARHLLVNEDRKLAGVIDWGDVHLGDPAADLMIAHSFLPPTAHAAFRQAYGPIEEETWHLARLRALWHTVTVVAYGHEIGDAALLHEGQRGLRHLAAG
jgi:aminoglycoside phosphotransferase (APT) family kinase protein